MNGKFGKGYKVSCEVKLTRPGRFWSVFFFASAYDRSILALKLKPVIAAKAKGKQIESGGAVPQKSAKPPIETRQEIAKAAGVSHDTIAKVERIEQQATPEVKAALKSGELSINQAYQDIKRAEKIQRQAETRERTDILENSTKSCLFFRLNRALLKWTL